MAKVRQQCKEFVAILWTLPNGMIMLNYCRVDGIVMKQARPRFNPIFMDLFGQ